MGMAIKTRRGDGGSGGGTKAEASIPIASRPRTAGTHCFNMEVPPGWNGVNTDETFAADAMLLDNPDTARYVHLRCYRSVRFLLMPNLHNALRGRESTFRPLQVAQMRLDFEGFAARLHDLDT